MRSVFFDSQGSAKASDEKVFQDLFEFGLIAHGPPEHRSKPEDRSCCFSMADGIYRNRRHVGGLHGYCNRRSRIDVCYWLYDRWRDDVQNETDFSLIPQVRIEKDVHSVPQATQRR